MERLPEIGLGTPTDPAACRRAVRTALDAGYRFVDTAQMYDNERAVGAGLAESEIQREDLVVAMKLASGNLCPDAARNRFRGVHVFQSHSRPIRASAISQ